jgi:hypothetical protein
MYEIIMCIKNTIIARQKNISERQEAKDMRKLSKKRNVDDILKSCHTVVDGVPTDKLNAEEMELYRFMVGGVQAK